MDCSTPLPGVSTSQGSYFNLTVGGFTATEVETAANYWQCPGYSGEIPTFEVDRPGGVPVLVAKRVGSADPVWFDIDADGDMELMSWTNEGEGLLALDRNGNGSIDHGGELFGDATVLADGTRAENGYLALAELDSWAFGGNSDGWIDAADAAFGTLRLWRDRDHSGTSRPDELHTLAEAGIRRIGLSYRTSQRRDRYGNEFRYLGRAWKVGPNGVLRPILTWDVFFLVAPDL